MGKNMRGGKRTALIICLIALVISIPVVYLAMRNRTINNVDTSQTLNMDEFNFRLSFNTYGRNQIDTYDGTFTKGLANYRTETIKFKIPDPVKKNIYNFMMDIDIMSFPETLKVDGMYVTPACHYKLTVTIEGKTKNIVWNDGFDTSDIENLPTDNANFLRLVKDISDYIYSTEEYKSMSKAESFYE